MRGISPIIRRGREEVGSASQWPAWFLVSCPVVWRRNKAPPTPPRRGAKVFYANINRLTQRIPFNVSLNFLNTRR